jgi:BolA protein
MSMQVQNTIENKLSSAIELVEMQVINESANHNVPPGSESHFKLVLVSDAFASLTLLARHRLINSILADELSGPVHALAIHAYTIDEWRKQGNAPSSPQCRGGEG